MDKKKIQPSRKGEVNKKEEPKFATMDELTDWVIDLPEIERTTQETTQAIADTLQYFVDKQNEKANGYVKDFKERVQEKFEHKIWKKYFGNKSKREMLPKVVKDPDINAKWQSYQKDIKATDSEIKKEFNKETYAAIKRLFNKEITSHERNDIDKEAGLFLLKLARFFKNENFKGFDGKNAKNVAYEMKSVPYGARGEKGFQYNGGGTRKGLDIVNYKKTIQEGEHKGETNISLFNSLAIADKHPKENGPKNMVRPTSSTHIIFEILKELDVFHPVFKEQLERFVAFVDKADSQYYQFGGADNQVSHKTLFGLHRKVGIAEIYAYFENPNHTGFEVLDEEEIKKLHIKNNSQEEKNTEKINEYTRLEKQGRFGNFNNERFIFALGKEFIGGEEISGALGGLGTFKLFDTGDIYMYSSKKLPRNICGFSTNDHFLNIKKINLKDLEKLLDIFEFGIDADDKLKETFLEYRRNQIQKEQEERERVKTERGNKENLEDVAIEELEIGKIYDGIIKQVNGKNIFVYITPTIVAMIKNEIRDKTLTEGQKIRVKIRSITQGKDRPHIDLEKVS